MLLRTSDSPPCRELSLGSGLKVDMLVLFQRSNVYSSSAITWTQVGEESPNAKAIFENSLCNEVESY